VWSFGVRSRSGERRASAQHASRVILVRLRPQRGGEVGEGVPNCDGICSRRTVRRKEPKVTVMRRPWVYTVGFRRRKSQQLSRFQQSTAATDYRNQRPCEAQFSS